MVRGGERLGDDLAAVEPGHGAVAGGEAEVIRRVLGEGEQGLKIERGVGGHGACRMRCVAA